jgi:hypothetical protein
MIPTIEDIPTVEERESANSMFAAMVEAGMDVRGIARTMKHLGEILVLYAEQEDRMIKSQKSELAKIERGQTQSLGKSN